MKRQGGLPPRDGGRHWLPSQGVDPAPLTELNAECLGQLVMRAAEGDLVAPAPPLLVELQSHWAALPAHAVRRLSAAPFSLFDAGFASAPRWLELRARGVHELPQRGEPAFFEASVARSITRRMLVYGWHLARSRPRAACLVFGSTIAGRRIAGGLFAGGARSCRRTQCRRVAAALAEPVRFLARAAGRGVGRHRPSPARTTARRTFSALPPKHSRRMILEQFRTRCS